MILANNQYRLNNATVFAVRRPSIWEGRFVYLEEDVSLPGVLDKGCAYAAPTAAATFGTWIEAQSQRPNHLWEVVEVRVFNGEVLS